MTADELDLHMEELVVDGVDVGSREPLGPAVERELELMLDERGVPVALGANHDIASVDVGTLATDGVESAARQIAEAVYRGLSR